MFVVLAAVAVCLIAPVDGAIAEPFSPSGQYSGHWGVDFESEIGDNVRAPVAGSVSFAGSVAGMRSVTIQPVGGFKVSISYLASIGVSRGAFVRSGQVIGTAGVEKRIPGVHMSTRIGGKYVDPVDQMGCRTTDITRALRLVAPPQPYPRSRANRNSRRNLRPDSYRPPPRRGDSVASGRSRSGPVHPHRPALAEGQIRSDGCGASS